MERGRTAAPSLGLMHFGLMLAGLGTALLGPILPVLARQWGMLDSQSGLLMMAKFCGAFLGGVTVSGKLRRSLLVGMMAGAVGFGGFAIAPSMSVGYPPMPTSPPQVRVPTKVPKPALRKYHGIASPPEPAD